MAVASLAGRKNPTAAQGFGVAWCRNHSAEVGYVAHSATSRRPDIALAGDVVLAWIHEVDSVRKYIGLSGIETLEVQTVGELSNSSTGTDVFRMAAPRNEHHEENGNRRADEP